MLFVIRGLGFLDIGLWGVLAFGVGHPGAKRTPSKNPCLKALLSYYRRLHNYQYVLWFHLPYRILVYGTSNGPQNDIGNYLGPCSSKST